MGIKNISTTKGNGDEQEEIKLITTHTKLDSLQRNRLIRIWIALYLPIHFEDERSMSKDSEKQSIPSKIGVFYDIKDSKMI